jgi:hypothetical protein
MCGLFHMAGSAVAVCGPQFVAHATCLVMKQGTWKSSVWALAFARDASHGVQCLLISQLMLAGGAFIALRADNWTLPLLPASSCRVAAANRTKHTRSWAILQTLLRQGNVASRRAPGAQCNSSHCHMSQSLLHVHSNPPCVTRSLQSLCQQVCAQNCIDNS